MAFVRTDHVPEAVPPLTTCACQSPVCPEDHGPGWTASADPSLIGLAVGVRRVVSLPVPRARRRFALAWPLQVRRT